MAKDKIWKGRFPEISMISLSISCMHCLEPECVEACPEEAILKRSGDGIVLVDQEKCSGCQTCLEVCPYNIPQFGSDGKMQKCDFCYDQNNSNTTAPPCVATCPTNSLELVLMKESEKRINENTLLDIKGL